MRVFHIIPSYRYLTWLNDSQHCLQMHASERILTNGSFNDKIEIEVMWVVTTTFQIVWLVFIISIGHNIKGF